MLELEFINNHFVLDLVELDPTLSYNRQYFDDVPVRYAHSDLVSSLQEHTPLDTVFDRFPEADVLVAYGRGFLISQYRRNRSCIMTSPGGIALPRSFALVPRLSRSEKRPIVGSPLSANLN